MRGDADHRAPPLPRPPLEPLRRSLPLATNPTQARTAPAPQRSALPFAHAHAHADHHRLRHGPHRPQPRLRTWRRSPRICHGKGRREGRGGGGARRGDAHADDCPSLWGTRAAHSRSRVAVCDAWRAREVPIAGPARAVAIALAKEDADKLAARRGGRPDEHGGGVERARDVWGRVVAGFVMLVGDEWVARERILRPWRWLRCVCVRAFDF